MGVKWDVVKKTPTNLSLEQRTPSPGAFSKQKVLGSPPPFYIRNSVMALGNLILKKIPGSDRSRYVADVVCYEHVAPFCFLGWDIPLFVCCLTADGNFLCSILSGCGVSQIIRMSDYRISFCLWIFKKAITIIYITYLKRVIYFM